MIRPVKLARTALEAEGHRLRGMATRIGTRIGLAVVAAVFLLGVLVFIHVAAWYWIAFVLNLGPIVAAAILAAVDLLIAIILGAMAARSTPSQTEKEALEIRQRALTALATDLSLSRIAVPLVRAAPGLVFRRRRRRR